MAIVLVSVKASMIVLVSVTMAVLVTVAVTVLVLVSILVIVTGGGADSEVVNTQTMVLVVVWVSVWTE